MVVMVNEPDVTVVLPEPLEAAKDVTKATATDFGGDAVGAVLAKYDTNGDGLYQIEECAAARHAATRGPVLPTPRLSPLPFTRSTPPRRLTGCARSCTT